MTLTAKSVSSKDGVRLALDALESATGLLKTARAIDFAYYYVGTLPFLWLLTEFWAEMSRSANAGRRLWSMAFGLAVAYIWMKVGQTFFVQRLLLILRDEPRRWSFREAIRIARYAVIVQTSALAVTVFASCLLIPTAWTVAFYHHAQCNAEPEQKDVLSSVRSALVQSQLWPRQNHTLISLHAAFGLLVFINVWVTLLALPELVQSLLGIEIRLLASSTIPYNSTLLATAFTLTWAFVDPFLKAAYAVRTFQAVSVTTGRDLTVAWRRSLVEKALGFGLLIAVVTFPLPAWADSTPNTDATSVVVDANANPLNKTGNEPGEFTVVTNSARYPDGKKLERQLTEVLKRPVFAWRMPREAIDEEQIEQSNPIRQWLMDTLRPIGGGIKKAIGWVMDVVRWFLSLDEQNAVPGVSSQGGWQKFADRGTVVLAIIALLVPFFILGRRLWLSRRPTLAVTSNARVETASVDEGTEAAKLPTSEWQRQAEQLLLAGERRLALRALFLGELSYLIQAGYLVASAHKSVGDYRRDLERRAHVRPNTYRGYCTTAPLFEQVWYGNLAVTDTVLEQFAGGDAVLRQDA